VTQNQTEATAPEARLGLVIDERYQIVELLGSGGMANVYRAEHVRTRAPVAIKVLHQEFSEHSEVLQRFQREAQAARRIQHPHVIAASDIGRLSDGCMYLVLEYVQGRDLSWVLHEAGVFPPERATKIALQVAQGLIAAHQAGIVHRDLKPDNIMLVQRDADPDFVKVVDFGIAKLTQARGQALTALGSVFGTPEYMAPEQARGGQIDHRTDLYTLGIVLYEMLSGATPFADEHLPQVIIGQISKPPPPLPSTIDADLAALTLQLLAKDPKARIQTAQELADRLQSILARIAPDHPALNAAAAPPSPASVANVSNPPSNRTPPPRPSPAVTPAPAPAGWAPVDNPAAPLPAAPYAPLPPPPVAPPLAHPPPPPPAVPITVEAPPPTTKTAILFALVVLLAGALVIALALLAFVYFMFPR
jgi:serine/threonine-protein kinase